MKSLGFLLVGVVLSLFIPSVANAQSDDFDSFSTNSGFGFMVKQIVWNIHEAILLDPQQKAELKVQHAQELQSEIEDLVEENKPIPKEINDVRIEKLNEVEEILNDNEIQNSTPISKIEELKTKLQNFRTISEVNEIRVLYGQFDSIQATDDEGLKDNYNDMVNSLDSWKDNCDGMFDIDEFNGDSKSDVSYNQLAVRCPILQNYDKTTVLSLIG